MGSDRAIGKDNHLLWHLPTDLRRFKALTTGHAILMGRRTWESLPNGALPNRRNVVVSRTLEHLDGAEVYPSIAVALEALAEEEEVFVIGGGEIYKALVAHAQRIYLTIVDEVFPNADTHFPELEWDSWEIQHREACPRDERNELGSTYYLLARKQ